jgi:FkbM family methyltransferase
MIVSYGDGEIHVSTDSFIEWSILLHGSYENEVIRFVRSLISPGMVCLDIGANIGCFTLPLAWGAGPSGKVLSYEPRTDLYQRLQKNCALNHLAQVQSFCFALSDKNGEFPLFIESAADCNKGKSSLVKMESHGITTEMKIVVKDAAQEPSLTSLDRCDFIKIDTEGHESTILKSLQWLLVKFRPKILFEFSPEHWAFHGQPTLDPIAKYLWDLDYTLKMVDVSGRTNSIQKSALPSQFCNIFAEPLSG